MKYLLYIPILLGPLSALAEEENRFYIGGSALLSAQQQNWNETESIGYEGYLGYRYAEQRLLFEGGYMDINPFDSDEGHINPMFLRFKAAYPVSDYAELYLGTGGAYNNSKVDVLGLAGVHYKVSNDWYADFGYQVLFDGAPNDSDVHSIKLGMVYKFPSKETYIAPTSPKEQVIAPVVSVVPVAATDNQKETIAAQCEVAAEKHTIKSGEYLHKLATEYSVSLSQLVELNPELQGRDLDLVYPGEQLVYNVSVCP